MNFVILVIFLLLFIGSSKELNVELNDITFLILSQKNKYHSGIGESLRRSIIEQSLKLERGNKNPGNIFLSHQIFDNSPGAWAITPVLPQILDLVESSKWLVICEDQSVVNVQLLLENLGKENYESNVFLGYPLHDREATIIHHFAQDKSQKFYYPLLRGGCIFSIPLLRLMEEHRGNVSMSTDFFIDGPYELAQFIREKCGTNLTHASYLCHTNLNNECAIYAREINSQSAQLKVPLNRVFFAVKTCRKFHKTRVPVVLSTWGKYVKHIRFFSDISDSKIPTISTEINTEIGHCEKTIRIFQLILNELSSHVNNNSIEWIFLVDDDTILGVSSLLKYLSNFNYREDFFIGERYGYHLLSNSGGYNYVTGGGGIILSTKIIKNLVQTCSCPSNSSPDDMIIAACLQRFEIEPIHSSLFHQARPNDYPAEVLEPNSISFHKHWQINANNVYAKWFEGDDQIMFAEFQRNESRLRHKKVGTNCLDGICKKNQNKVQHTDL